MWLPAGGIRASQGTFSSFNMKGFNSVKYTVRNEEQELILCIIQLNLKFIPTHTPGPSCSKLTTSLVNNLLKFQSNMNITNICTLLFFVDKIQCNAKDSHILSTKITVYLLM